jgi:hypothetical protein
LLRKRQDRDTGNENGRVNALEKRFREMTKGMVPDLPAQPGSLGRSGNAVRGSLPWGWRAGFSVKVHRGIALVIISSVLIWGGLFLLLRLLED